MESNRGFYNTLAELPIYNWWQLHQEGEKKYLVKNPLFVGRGDDLYEDAYMKLYQEYIDRYGHSLDYETRLDKIKEKIELTNQYVQGDRIQINFVRIIEEELKNETEEDEEQTLESVMFYINKYLGYRNDSKKMSVVEFKEVLKQIEEDGKANQGLSDNRG